MSGHSSIAPAQIRPATPADAEAVAAIYAHHVLHGTATFEIEPPEAAEIAARMAKVRAAGLPWLIAQDADGVVLGYAYAGAFHARAAYGRTCEDAIYIAHDRLGQGVGKALLAALLEACAAAGQRQMIALIAGTEPASIALHLRAGFVEAGRLASVGRKHGRWLDVVYMQRALGVGDTTAPENEPA
ncbi:GNAT family N-acetyltransferase [Novosphingobium sp. JCM 18896]|uniref:GNAT family N-acetyltransferase n=1 Tax=Novosphingobium sp. JCM 18896 TaxID=2989731 RepID=UPI0022228BB8|nr:GNAT family N-acetyltransferase [Novosphingobium sp. JCM 18896]MCW1430329.1 GNAT family N-acetyltransferase [Novosphingobium sp. JCM 18896]